MSGEALRRELEHHEQLYSGFAQRHFARPAVRAFRKHLARRILSLTSPHHRPAVLSLGCGIGDTELLLAERAGSILGVDLSPSGIRQAREDAQAWGLRNVRFMQGTINEVKGRFDVVIAIFFLHHLADSELNGFPARLKQLLAPGGMFYSLDPSVRRLSGAIGKRLFPGLMKKYQTEGERELDPGAVAKLFTSGGFQAQCNLYDFVSTPLAGLLPGWRAGYHAARSLDNLLLKSPAIRRLGSNFELIAFADSNSG